MQVDLQKVLSVSGHPGLYKYLSQARQGIIVESLKDKKRMCLPASSKVSSLGDITIFTQTDDVLLKEVLLKIKEKQNGELAISHKSAIEEITQYFESVLPEYDKERVYTSHMKKIIEWYNILQENDMLDFIETKEEEKEESQKQDE